MVRERVHLRGYFRFFEEYSNTSYPMEKLDIAVEINHVFTPFMCFFLKLLFIYFLLFLLICLIICNLDF